MSKRVHEKIRHIETRDTLTTLIEEGVEKISIIMRHSHRFFGGEPRMEPFMGLTEKGKEYAMTLGEILPNSPVPRFFTSYFGRCIDTACQMDKGFLKTHGIVTKHSVQCTELTPFYINDMQKAITMARKMDNPEFLRLWFNCDIDEGIMLHPKTTVETIIRFMAGQLPGLEPCEIAVNVSHDWNLFPLKDFILEQPHETVGLVGYLESIALFEKGGKHYMTNYHIIEEANHSDNPINRAVCIDQWL